MGETAELIIEGFVCQHCGEYLDGDDPGYPRSCNACEKEKEPSAPTLDQK